MAAIQAMLLKGNELFDRGRTAQALLAMATVVTSIEQGVSAPRRPSGVRPRSITSDQS